MIDELLSGSIVQTSLLFALIFPAAMIAAGAVISGVQHFLTKIITAILGSGFTFILVNYLMFPGVMLHEISQRKTNTIGYHLCVESKIWGK